MRTMIFIAASLDGFIAREDNSLDWLENPHTAPGQDYGYQRFIESVGASLMGRNTFDVIRDLKDWSKNDLPTFVLSHRSLDLPEEKFKNVERIEGQPVEILENLKKRGFSSIYIDGGKVITEFIDHSLIDEMIITTIPVLLGKGIPLFGHLNDEIRLQLLSTVDFKDGFVQSSYKVLKG